MLKRTALLNEKNLAFWVDERESPYTEVKRFDWFRGYQVGGRSLMWGRQSYRWSDFDFEANAKDGIAIDWPIRYADLAPWYDHVEKHAGISGSREGLPQLPDGQFQPPMPLNCGEELVAGRLKKAFDGKRQMIIGRTANATQALEGRAPCQYRRRVLAGLSLRRLLQHAVLDAARRGEDREAHAEAVVDRDRGALRQGSQARHRRAGARRPDRSDDRLQREGRLPLRVDAQLDVAAHAIRDRRVAGRTRQQLRRARPQPHGSSLSLRRGRADRGAGRQVLLRSPPQRHLHPALSQSVRRQARLPARLRLPGQREPRGTGRGR